MGTEVQPKFHVVTYVQHGDGFEEPVAQGILEQPTKSREEPGDATKAVLGTVDEFVCDGSDAHEGDEKTYQNAEERVIARLHKGERIDVTWRKYRPLVATGQVEPGAPFEHSDGDTTVRIEARRVVADDAELPKGSISITDLAVFQKTLKGKTKGAETRGHLRDALAQFEGLRNAADAEVAAYQKRLGPATLPKELKAASEESLAAIGEVFDRFRDDCVALLAEEIPETKAAKAIIKRVTKKSFAEAMKPLVALDEQSKKFQALSAAIDAAEETSKAFTARGARAKRKAHVERLDSHPKPAKVKDTAVRVEEALTGIYADALASTKDVLVRAKDVLANRREDEIDAITKEIKTLLADTKTKVRKAIAPFKKLEKDLSDGVCSGFVEITPVMKGKQIVRWDVRFENTGDEPWIGTQAFVDSDKNDGAGFESMGLPKSGSAAIQPIYAQYDYGVRPRPGVRLRIAIRGRSFLEVPLPKGEPALYPVSAFERMGRDDSDYRTHRTVESKRDEKIDDTHDDGTQKIKFYQGAKRL